MVTIPEQEPYIQALNPEWYQQKVSQVDMLRLDVIHPVVSGNKWYKLRYYLQTAKNQNARTILTFGGAYSNHLVATAAAANNYGFQSIGIVRGFHANETSTSTLRDCRDCGMQLVFVSREEYERKYDASYHQHLKEVFPEVYIIAEGGAGEQGVSGSETIAAYVPRDYTHVCLSAGTGTTLCGIRRVLPDNQQVYGYVPMKGGKYIEDEIDKYLFDEKKTGYSLFDDWHFGGFGKSTIELITSMNDFYTMNNIPLDMVYTAKMMFGIREQILSGYFPEQAKVLCIHTGGLQGNSTIKDKLIY